MNWLRLFVEEWREAFLCRWGGRKTLACYHPAACGCQLMSRDEFERMKK